MGGVGVGVGSVFHRSFVLFAQQEQEEPPHPSNHLGKIREELDHIKDSIKHIVEDIVEEVSPPKGGVDRLEAYPWCFRL